MKSMFISIKKLDFKILFILICLSFYSCQKKGSSNLKNNNPVQTINPEAVENNQNFDENLSPKEALKIFEFKNQFADQKFETDNDEVLQANIIEIQNKFKDLDEKKIFLFANYLTYIKLSPETPGYDDLVSRLANSSLEFIFCSSFEDTDCLEGNTVLKAAPEMRIDSLPDLSKPIFAGKRLNIEYYFTQGWYYNFINKPKTYVVPERTVAKKLGEKISHPANKNVYLAMYGIDDLQDTMSFVFNAIKKQIVSGKSVKAVVDVNDAPQPNSFIRDYNLEKGIDDKYIIKPKNQDLDYSYYKPTNTEYWAFGAPLWTEEYLKSIQVVGKDLNKTELKNYILNNMISVDPTFEGNSSAVIGDLAWIGLNLNSTNYNDLFSRMSYGYKGSHALMQFMNQNITSNEESNLRIEYPYSGIMHNKFVVFENEKGIKSVWTGTANISKNCMGSEENANLSIQINNDLIAQSFKNEFNEMFNPYIDEKRPQTLLTGAFHTKKRPNTNRYFKFADGTDVRVHFSPTDDAEHKVILPLIYSAREGDILRISMFGNSGFEIVRALQSALAKGVNIKLAVDKLTGLQSESWIKSKAANLFEKNPFAENPKGLLEIRKNEWPGLNHHKSATLSRRLANGKFKPETIIIGSQNWSKSGNDLNDENVVTITNKKRILDIMLVYNREFDEKIWTSSVPVVLTETPVVGSGTLVQEN